MENSILRATAYFHLFYFKREMQIFLVVDQMHRKAQIMHIYRLLKFPIYGK